MQIEDAGRNGWKTEKVPFDFMFGGVDGGTHGCPTQTAKQYVFFMKAPTNAQGYWWHQVQCI